LVVFNKASFAQPKENKVALVAGRTVKKSTNFKYYGAALARKSYASSQKLRNNLSMQGHTITQVVRAVLPAT
jgi:hypothetical protein